MNKKINYNDKDLAIYGGTWLDVMNSCFYTVIDKIKDFDICVENGTNNMFALPNYNN